MSQQVSRDTRAGIAYMLLGIVLLPVMNAIAKSLTADYPLTQVVWARFLGHLVWMSLFFGPFLGIALLRTRHTREMIGRSFVFFASNCVFIAALPYIQLATASAIMFTTPLVVVALSVPLLKERVGPWRSAAVVVGFCGALVIIRPGTDVFQPAALLMLLSAICFAGYQLWTRRLARYERPETLIIYTALAGAIVMSLIAPFTSRPPDDIVDTLKFAGVGLIGGAAQYFIICALLESACVRRVTHRVCGAHCGRIIRIRHLRRPPRPLHLAGRRLDCRFRAGRRVARERTAQVERFALATGCRSRSAR